MPATEPACCGAFVARRIARVIGFLAACASMCLDTDHALAASTSKVSGGTFAALPKDNRFGLAAGVGMNAGLAGGFGWTGQFAGVEVLAGYQPMYHVLYPQRPCSYWCVSLDLPNGFRVDSGTALSIDLLLPLLCDRLTCVGLKGGFRRSSLLGNGGGASLYVQTQSRSWVRFAVALGLSYYKYGGGSPLFLGADVSPTLESTSLGLEFTLALAPWRLGTGK